MLRVKICGITRLEDALLAAKLGADAIGFVFYDKSPRYFSPRAAAQISQNLPPHIARVGVFVNPDQAQVMDILLTVHLNAIQLHGLPPGKPIAGYNGMPVIPAIPVKDISVHRDIKFYRQSMAAALLDSFHPDLYGGSGMMFDWKYAAEAAKTERIILAGGLRPENVAAAVKRVKPYGVDVSSGVESCPGQKDAAKLTAFFTNLRKYRRDWKPERIQLFPLA